MHFVYLQTEHLYFKKYTMTLPHIFWKCSSNPYLISWLFVFHSSSRITTELTPILMKVKRVIFKMAAGSNSSVLQNLLTLSRQNEFSDLPAGCHCNKIRNFLE